ncbi:MAG TPA: hypothetical protein VJM49_19390 [Acidimicrobiales bacterium]|nr:hypothetical protein [Acidimicrobiales bacterium]
MPRRSRSSVSMAVACAGALALWACGAGGDEPRDGLDADTARFTYGDRSVEVPLTACGREGDTVVLAGTTGSVVLQASADLGDGGFDRTGVTADLGDDGIFGAFGADMPQGPAGEITDVRADGDRLVVEGRWTTFDGELRPQPTPAADQVEGRMVARCPETDPETD